MEKISNLETLIASWCKDLPHLPPAGRQWLATNIWWLMVIGVILSGIATIGLVIGGLFLSLVLGTAWSIATAVIGLIVTFVGSVVGVVYLVLGIVAIPQLKAGRKKGWSLLFLMAIIEVVTVVLGTLLSFVGLVWALLTVAVGLYFLFEIRDYFIDYSITPKKSAR